MLLFSQKLTCLELKPDLFSNKVPVNIKERRTLDKEITILRHMPGEGVGSVRKVGRVLDPNACRGHTGCIKEGSQPGVRKAKLTA